MKLKELFFRLYRRIPIVRELLSIKDTLDCLQSNLLTIHGMQAIYYYNQELQSNPKYATPLSLTPYSFQVNSQNGEDGIIQEIFKRIGTKDKVFVEIGVGNGNENNTAFLLTQGWRGYWIDGNNEFVQVVRKNKLFEEKDVKCLVAFVSKENIENCFADMKIPFEFDLLSIDIDQNTYQVWEGLVKYRPRVVIVEYNATFPPNIDWKVNYQSNKTWDGSINFGASLKAFEILGRKREYSLVVCDWMGVNAFFVRNDLINSNFLEPFTAENHYERPRYQFVHRQGHLPTILDKAQYEG